MELAINERLSEAKEVNITTYDLNGIAGTVPVWFVSEENRVFVYTGIQTIKARRIEHNSKVSLSFHGHANENFSCNAKISDDNETIEKAVNKMAQKYGSDLDTWFGGTQKMFENLFESKKSVLLEIITESDTTSNL